MAECHGSEMALECAGRGHARGSTHNERGLRTPTPAHSAKKHDCHLSPHPRFQPGVAEEQRAAAPLNNKENNMDCSPIALRRAPTTVLCPGLRPATSSPVLLVCREEGQSRRHMAVVQPAARRRQHQHPTWRQTPNNPTMPSADPPWRHTSRQVSASATNCERIGRRMGVGCGDGHRPLSATSRASTATAPIASRGPSTESRRPLSTGRALGAWRGWR